MLDRLLRYVRPYVPDRVRAVDDRVFVRDVFRGLLGRDPDPDALAHFTGRLASGVTRPGLIEELVASDEFRLRLDRPALAEVERTEAEDFVTMLYRRLLDRDPEVSALEERTARLRAGLPRWELACHLAESDEFVARARSGIRVRRDPAERLPDLTLERPELYGFSADGVGRRWLSFVGRGPDDVDWLERRILETGFYEGPGAWTFEVNDDKRHMARLVAALGPSSALDLGCSSGGLVACLVDEGVDARGVDLSEFALQHAPDGVRDRLVHGDLLEADVGAPAEAVIGLDVFEHLNPNRIDEYVGRVADLVAPGGVVVANIPALGPDEVFGEPFPAHLPDWADEPEPQLRMPVDEKGFPEHGHLVWASSPWWVDRFAAAGLVRLVEAERAVQERFAAYLTELAPARRSLYLFGRGEVDGAALAARVRAGGAQPSASPNG